MLSINQIEQIEEKYLKKFFHLMKYAEDKYRKKLKFYEDIYDKQDN